MKQNKKQKVKCLFDHHDWRWSLTEITTCKFIITGVCRICNMKNVKIVRVFSLADAFIQFAELTKGKK